MVIKIGIVNKYASQLGGERIVCGNNDYSIKFEFDAEWEGIEYKTARFVYVQDGVVRYQDVVFQGDTIEGADVVPVFANIREVLIGVYAGDLKTSTPARVICEKSIRCGTAAPPDPTPGVYDQIMELLTQVGGGAVTDEQIQNAVDNYFEENPVGKDKELQLYSYATRVQNAQTPNTLTLALMADTHYCDRENNSEDKLDTAKTMGLLSHYANVDAIVNLGDVVRGDETKSETVNDLTALIESTKENANCPVYFVRGNHDDNGWYSYEGDGTNQPDELINNAEWCQIVGNTFVTDENNPNCGYGFFDHEKSKIRVFLLNSSDIPYVFNADGSYRYNGYQCYAFSNAQLNFVANALRFEDKETPNEWGAMFLMHAPLDTTNANGYRFGCAHALVRGSQQMLAIITAYKNGTNYKFNGSINNTSLGELAEDFTVNIDVDYSTKGAGDVICFVNGHTHTDNASQKVGYENSLSYGYTYLGIIGATAFATMVVDREKSIVSTFKYGEVRSQTDSETINHNIGAVNGEIEFDIDMSTGTWVIPFEQFRPTSKNLYNGLSELWGDNYFHSNSATLDLETLELSTATANVKYALSKAVLMKPDTEYMIPSDIGGSLIYQYTNAGKYNGQVTPTERDGYKIITDKFSSGGYFVFCFHKNTYTDYENFYIREVVAETPEEPVDPIEYVTKEEFTNTIGDINTALENIIEIQENLIGGVTE